MPPLEVEASERIQSLDILSAIETQGVMIDDREGVALSLDTLRSEFAIEDEALARPKNRLMLTAVAQYLNKTEKTEAPVGAKAAELEYVADLVMDTVGDYSGYKEQFQQTVESDVSEERVRAAYDKFTQPEVSGEMDAFIRGPQFDELRKRLGVTEEAPYEVRVLSIDDEDGGQSFGLDPRIDWDDREAYPSHNDAIKEMEYRKDYKAGLVANGNAFNEALGREGSFAPAWVTTFEDGTKYLCLPLPMAEKVLYKDEARAEYYDQDAYDRDVAIVMHEYTHTQKGLNTGMHIGTGIALEELRAEHFSGDKHGYTDIKKFFTGMKMLTGFSPKDSLEAGGQGYDEEAFLLDIAKKAGLQGLLDCMSVVPANYAEDEDANPYLKAIVAHNGGGLSEHFKQLYDRTVAERGAEAVEANVSAFIDRVRDTLKDKGLTVESWLAYGRNTTIRDIGIENFRRRYPAESDDYDYWK